MTRCVLIIAGTAHPLRVVPDTNRAEAGIACPVCGEPLLVVGNGPRPGGHDYYTAEGFCAACVRAADDLAARDPAARPIVKPVGEIRAYVGTIFGVEEDERVLHGRARVY